tara:strand:- start:155 stop:502 length:348 start_codon:yes stop_codon:yes gene_type:complete
MRFLHQTQTRGVPVFNGNAGSESRGIVKDHAADQRNLNSESPATPEQVVLSMTLGEVQELLAEVSMSSDVITAQRLKRLVRELGQFELAIEAIGGPVCLGDQPTQPRSCDMRRAA